MSQTFNLWYPLVAVESAEELLEEFVLTKRLSSGKMVIDLAMLLFSGSTLTQRLFGLHARADRRALALAFLLRRCLTNRAREFADRIGKLLYVLQIRAGFAGENLLFSGGVYGKSGGLFGSILISLVLTAVKAREWMQTELSRSLSPIPFPQIQSAGCCGRCSTSLSLPISFDSQGHLFHSSCAPPSCKLLRPNQ